MGVVMKSKNLEFGLPLISILALLLLGACDSAHGDPVAEAPPPANVVPGVDPTLFTVDHPEQFPLATATALPTTSEMIVTGAVTPDISRNVPVVSLASGRVVDIRPRLGDTVQKGQLLLAIRSDDVAGGFDAYRKAVADEFLMRKQLQRAVDLYAHGAIAQQDLEVAQDAADDAKVTLETATEHLRLLGNDPDKPRGMVDIVAPTTGVITDQGVTTRRPCRPTPRLARLRSRICRRSRLSATSTRMACLKSGSAISQRSL
jgi:cobalt-zinc-cadmium efflux system membrane fusion protein